MTPIILDTFSDWYKEIEEKEHIRDFMLHLYPKIKLSFIFVYVDKKEFDYYTGSLLMVLEKEVYKSKRHYIQVAKDDDKNVFLCAYPTEKYALLKRLEVSYV